METEEKIDDEDDFFTKLMNSSPEIKQVTVKFTTLDDKIFTQAYAEKSSIAEVKGILSEVFAVPSSCIELQHEEHIIADTTKLYELTSNKLSQLNLKLQSNNTDYTISAENAYKDLVIPDIITVHIETDEGEYKNVIVEIENRCIDKPFLGGFINKKTEVIYHHGYTQTGPPKPKVPPEMKNHRDTQTYFLRNRKLDTYYSRGTQMSNEETWINPVNDKILKAGPYETADEWEKRRNLEGKIKIIQRYFRAWKMRMALKILSAEYKKRIEKELEELRYNEEQNEIRKKKELIAKIFPRSKADFAMLYNMIDKWKKSETERIKAMTCGPARIAEMYLLLEKEVEMLRSLERQKKQVKLDKMVQRDIDFFKTIGDPLEWNSYYKNLYIQMDTLETQKGREYHELYLNVCNKNLDRESRLEALLNIKTLLKDHICQISMELLRLVDRACELITRGLSNRHLEVLQLRIEGLLMYHIKQPECSFNVTTRMIRVKEKLMEDNLFYCIRCKKLKTHDQFTLHSQTKDFRTCLSCTWDDRVIEPWVDLAPYRFMLRCIRREERRKLAPSSIAFILQDRDIHLLVTKVWHSHSAINECNDIYKLTLCRWFRDEDWAPWNSILLTHEEARIHLEIRNLEEVYDQEFLQHIYNKHALARKYYTVAFGLDSRFQEIGKFDTKWNEIIEFKDFVAVNSKTKIFLSCH